MRNLRDKHKTECATLKYGYVSIVPESDMKVLRKYLGPQCATVLIAAELFESLTSNEKQKVEEYGQTKVYDFGGDADITLDIVTGRDHFFLTEVFNAEGEEDDEYEY